MPSFLDADESLAVRLVWYLQAAVEVSDPALLGVWEPPAPFALGQRVTLDIPSDAERAEARGVLRVFGVQRYVVHSSSIFSKARP